MTTFLGDSAGYSRRIDRLPPPTTPRTIKVLCLGAPRSGTSSMTVALKTLGYRCYEGMGHSFRLENRYPHWAEAINAKYFGIGKPYDADDFDKILGGYEMVCSWPSVLFVDELLAAYPNAKVVLTTRDVDSWLASVKSTVWMIQSWKPSWDILTFFNRGRLRDFRNAAERCGAVWHINRHWTPDQARTHFLEHYAHVRRVVPKERLLEHHPKDGWKPLCEFLDQPVPLEEYPRVLDSEQFRSFFHKVWWAALGVAIAEVVVGAGVALFLYYQAPNMLRREWWMGLIPSDARTYLGIS